MPWLARQTVVVPIDFSGDALKAARVARSLVPSPQHLHIVHVIHRFDESGGPPCAQGAPTRDDVRMKRSLEILRSHLPGFEFEDAHMHIAIGDPGDEILHLAETVEAGLIVISSHGRTGLSRLVIGSVAERVVRYAPCPVLVLRGRFSVP